MTRFAEHAQNILDAATAAASRGERGSEMTILIGTDGGIQMVADSDWPLESLAVDRGARTAYRVTHRKGAVRVEGFEHPRTCVLEAKVPRGY